MWDLRGKGGARGLIPWRSAGLQDPSTRPPGALHCPATLLSAAGADPQQYSLLPLTVTNGDVCTPLLPWPLSPHLENSVSENQVTHSFIPGFIIL